MGYGNVAPAPLICTVWALASVAAARRARVARILFISFFPSEVDQHLQTVAGVVRPGGRAVVGLERVLVGKAGDAQTLQQDGAERERPHGAAELESLLVIDLGFVVVLAVIEAAVNVAVVAGEVPVPGEAGVGGADQADALGKERSLPAVAVNPLGVVDEGRLLHAEPHPRAVRRPVVETQLSERVLEAEDLAAAERRRRAGLARDVG